MRSNPITSPPQDSGWKILVEFELSGQPGSRPSTQEQVVAAVQRLHLSPGSLERLKAAIAEATLKANEWPELPVFIRILVSEGVTRPFQTANGPEQPVGRGWGFFLIHKIENAGEACYRIELFLYWEDDSS